jgi:acyl carrier protein
MARVCMRDEIYNKLHSFLKSKANNDERLSLDSLALASLIGFIQKEFAVSLNLDDVLDANNFLSIAHVQRLVERKISVKSGLS